MGQAQQVEAVVELAAELPPRQVRLRLHLDVVAGVDGLSVRWEALGGVGDAGMVAGQPGEVARAVGALVLRLAGETGGPLAVQDEEPTRPLARG